MKLERERISEWQKLQISELAEEARDDELPSHLGRATVAASKLELGTRDSFAFMPSGVSTGGAWKFDESLWANIRPRLGQSESRSGASECSLATCRSPTRFAWGVTPASHSKIFETGHVGEVLGPRRRFLVRDEFSATDDRK